MDFNNKDLLKYHRQAPRTKRSNIYVTIKLFYHKQETYYEETLAY